MAGGAPDVGSVHNGYKFLGGNHRDKSSWQQVEPVDVSTQYGNGATQLPNGDIVRYGPRGGLTVLQAGGVDADGPGKLTEGQGKAVLYGGMMAGAERDYQQARQEGYDPASFRNQAARVAGVIPFDGDFFGRLIRDDVSDRGNQAELRWAEGNLRQLTGAAATNPEIARVAAINFDRGNDELSDQRYRTRAETYEGTRYTAGPGAKVLKEYPGNRIGDNLEINAETGLPDYSGINASVAGVSGGYDIGPDGRPIAPAPSAPTPGGSPETAIDYTKTPPDQLLSLLANGGWVRQGDGEPYQVAAGSVTRSAGGREVAPGVNVTDRTDWTPEGAVAQRREMWNPARQVDAFVRGAADATSLEFADEIAAGADALVGRGNGRTLGDRYRNNVRVQRAIDKADGEDAGFARNAGEVAGYGVAALTQGPRLLAQGARRFGSPLLNGAVNGIRNALTGGAIAGTAAAGAAEGNALQRAQEALKAAPVGAVAGVVTPVAVNALAPRIAAPVQAVNRFAGRQVGRLGEQLGVPGAARLTERATPSALASAVEQYGARIGDRRVSALADNVQRQRDLGFQPTLADAVDDAGQGQLRALASIDTPARDRAVAFGRQRRAGAQEDVSTIARRFVSDDPRTATRVARDLEDAQTAASGPAYEAARASPPITVGADIGEALFSGEGPSTIRAAGRAYKSSVKPEERALALELEGLAQAADEGVPAGDIQMSVGAADLLSRYLNKAGGSDANLSRIYQGLGRAIRRTARDQSPAYDAAVSGYAERAQLDDATDFGRRFLTRQGSEDFANEAAAMLPAQRGVARVAARDTLEDAGSTPGGAATLLDNLAIGRGAGQRGDALIPEAGLMRDTAEAARMRLQTGRNIDPRAGSNTNLNRQDTENVDSAVEFLGDGARIIASPVRGTIDVVARRFQNRGFNRLEAEELVSAALDPTRTDDLVRMLSQRMTRKEARTLARAVQRQVSSGSGSSSAEQ